MAEHGNTELSDEEENSILVACMDSYESFAFDSLESLHEASPFEGTAHENNPFKDTQTENRDSSSSIGRVIPESSTTAAASQEMTKTLLKGSDLLTLVRPGYIWVTDLCRQDWCEMQMYYYLTRPVGFNERHEMQIGAAIHLADELAVNNCGKVNVESKEDGVGIRMLRLLTAVKIFHSNGTIARGVPVFGAPFGKKLFVFGLIDELIFNPAMYTTDLVELKTQKNKTLPRNSTKKQHHFQVNLYRKLFDDLVKGLVTKETVAEKFGISLDKMFGRDLRTRIINSGFLFANLDQLVEYLLRVMQSLTCISQVYVRYMHQETMALLGEEQVVYDEAELSRSFGRYADFWLGQRHPVGVDIEEAYKCKSCEHAHVCEWRKRKNEEYARQNRMGTTDS